MSKFELYDVVRLRVGRPEVGTSTKGAVVMVYDSSPPEYEVEFCDDEGRTLALLTLRAEDMERFEASSSRVPPSE